MKENNEFFNDLMESLGEALDHAQGKRALRTRRVCVAKPKEYTPDEVARIRASLAVSQAFFAEVLGVSKRTVEAWEHGYNTPNGAAARLLAIADSQPDVFRGLLMQTTTV